MILRIRMRAIAWILCLTLVGFSSFGQEGEATDTAKAEEVAEAKASGTKAKLTKEEKKEAKRKRKFEKKISKSNVYFQKGYYKTAYNILRPLEKKEAKLDSNSRILGILKLTVAKNLAGRGSLYDAEQYVADGHAILDNTKTHDEYAILGLIEAANAYNAVGQYYMSYKMGVLAEQALAINKAVVDFYKLAGDTVGKYDAQIDELYEGVLEKVGAMKSEQLLNDLFFLAESGFIQTSIDRGFYKSVEKRLNRLTEATHTYYYGNKKDMSRKKRKVWRERLARMQVMKADLSRERGDYQKAEKLYRENDDELKKLVGKRNENALRNSLGYALTVRNIDRGDDAEDYMKRAFSQAKKSNDISKGSKLYYDMFEQRLALYKEEEKQKKYKKVADKYRNSILVKYRRNNPLFLQQQIYENDLLIFFQTRIRRAESKVNRLSKRYDKSVPPNSIYNLSYLNQLFNVYIRQNRFDEAKSVQEEMERIRLLNYGKDAPVYHMGRLNMAEYATVYLNEFELAEKLYDTSFYQVASKELHQFHTEYFKYLNGLGELYEKTDRFDKAIQVLTQAKDITENKFGISSLKYGTALERLSGVYIAKGNYDQAEKFLEASIEIVKKEKGRRSIEYIRAIRSLGELYSINGKYAEAKEKIEESFKLSKRLGDELVVVPDLNSVEEMVELYIRTGKYDDAEKVLLDGLKQKKSKFGDDSYQLISTYRLLGELYLVKGEYIPAEQNAIQARDIALKTRSDTSLKYIGALALLGDIHSEMGRLDEALDNYNLTLTGSEKIFGNYHKNVAEAIMRVAELELRMQKPVEDIEKKLFRAKRIVATKLGEDHPDYALAMEYLAVNNIRRNWYDTAIDQLIVAREIYLKKLGGKSMPYADNLNLLGDLYYHQKRYTSAVEKYRESLKVFEGVFDKLHPKYVGTEGKLAQAYYSQNEFKQAMLVLDKTTSKYLEYIEKYFPSLSDKEKNKYWSSIKGDFELYNSLALRFGDEKPDVIGKMYNNKLATKAILLNSSIKVREAITNSGDLALIELYEAWVDKKEILTRSIHMSSEELAEKNINRETLQKDINELEKELSQRSDAFADNTKKLLNWKDVKGVLEDNEYAMEIIRFQYFKDSFTDSVIYAALIVSSETKKSPKLVVLDNGVKLEGRFYKRYRNSIKYKQEDLKSYEHYWAKLDRSFNPGSTVYISADGIFNQMNIETIQDRNGKFILDKYHIVYVSNTKDVVEYRREIAEEGRRVYVNSTATLIGNPSFASGSTDQKLNRANTVSSFEPLPGAEKEVKLLDQILENNNFKSETYIGVEASETKLKNIQSPRVLHIATHGFFVKDSKIEKEDIGVNKTLENPLLKSGLLFTGAAELLSDNNIYNFNKKDGILTAYEAMNLKLDHTELVVLSACETGLGEIKSGEGVYGLQRSFLVAGSQNIIMTLFKVNDAVTQELITEFYKRWLRTGDKRGAFFQAKKLIKDKYEEPIYWGSFVMIGMD